MLTAEIREQLLAELVEYGWDAEQASKLLSSFESCAGALQAGGLAMVQEVTVPIADLAAAVYAFGQLLGIRVSVAGDTPDAGEAGVGA